MSFLTEFDMVKNIYGKLYESQAKKLDLCSTPRIKVMLDMTDELGLKNNRILDIGCYDGTFLSLIRNRGNEFYGIEASDYGVKEAAAKGVVVQKLFVGDDMRFPFNDNFFDLVIIGEIIEHIYDTDFFLSEIRRILKIKGSLLVSTPNIASLGRRIMLLLGMNPIIELSPNEADSSGHIRYFTFVSLRCLLEKHGFRIIKSSSDVVNFSGDGRFRSLFLPKLFPTIGQSIIYLCESS
ncbi:MAG: class I SAM-dependent methyltransferase [Candidatus Omnitrophica bacterium]|nr:class I SAM-dependent methyltransferase [Candidatus Omnitrophota bacterium]